MALRLGYNTSWIRIVLEYGTSKMWTIFTQVYGVHDRPVLLETSSCLLRSLHDNIFCFGLFRFVFHFLACTVKIVSPMYTTKSYAHERCIGFSNFVHVINDFWQRNDALHKILLVIMRNDVSINHEYKRHV